MFTLCSGHDVHPHCSLFVLSGVGIESAISKFPFIPLNNIPTMPNYPGNAGLRPHVNKKLGSFSRLKNALFSSLAITYPSSETVFRNRD